MFKRSKITFKRFKFELALGGAVVGRQTLRWCGPLVANFVYFNEACKLAHHIQVKIVVGRPGTGSRLKLVTSREFKLFEKFVVGNVFMQ